MVNQVMRGLVALLAVAGIWVSVLALRVHRMDPNAVPPCAVDAVWDCGKVNHSSYSVFPPFFSYLEDPAHPRTHIPVAVIGIAGYALMLVLALFGRWWILLQVSEIGFGAACVLSYLEAYVIRSWCIYCVWSQGIATAIVVATAVALVLRRREMKRVIVHGH